MSDNFNQNPYGNQNYNNQQSQYVQYEPEKSDGKKGPAIASLVIGILMLLGGCCFAVGAVVSSVVLMVVPIVVSILGAILGIVSITSKQGGKGMAIAGIIISVISIIFNAYMLFSLTYTDKMLQQESGYTMKELVFALSEGEISQEEYQEIINDAMQ